MPPTFCSGRFRAGRRVVVIGGGAVGVETALFLAEKGTLSGDALKFLLIHGAESSPDLYDLAVRGTRDVTVIEMLDEVGKNFGRSTRWGMMQDVARYGVKTRTASTRSRSLRRRDGRGRRPGGEHPGRHRRPGGRHPTVLPLREIVAKRGIPFRTAGMRRRQPRCSMRFTRALPPAREIDQRNSDEVSMKRLLILLFLLLLSSNAFALEVAGMPVEPTVDSQQSDPPA